MSTTEFSNIPTQRQRSALYSISVRGALPLNIGDKISTAHADAIRFQGQANSHLTWVKNGRR